MINCLKTRFGVVHYISWSTNKGTHYTWCGKTFNNNRDHVETFGLDNSVREVCTNCYQAHESYYQHNLNTNIRETRSHMTSSVVGKYVSIQEEWGETPEIVYSGLLNHRYWAKARRMRAKFPR